MSDETQGTDQQGAGTQVSSEPAAPPPQPQYATKEDLASIQTMLQRNEQYLAALAQGVVQQQGRQAPPPDDADYMDPVVQKAVAKEMAKVQRTLQSAQEKSDFVQFQLRAQELGLEPETVRDIEAVYQDWGKKGIKLGDQPLSRLDAMNQVLGYRDQQRRETERGKRAKQEREIMEQNLHAQLETPGRSVRQEKPVDLEGMKRSERLAHLAKKLDSEGF